MAATEESSASSAKRWPSPIDAPERAKKQRRIFENDSIRREVMEDGKITATFAKGLCWRWNHQPEGCPSSAEDCRYRHVCSRCTSAMHREIECHVSYKGLSPNPIPLLPRQLTLVLMTSSDSLKMPLVNKVQAY